MLVLDSAYASAKLSLKMIIQVYSFCYASSSSYLGKPLKNKSSKLAFFLNASQRPLRYSMVDNTNCVEIQYIYNH